MSTSRVYQFGEFRLDADARLLFRGEERLALPPKAAHILTMLVENHGKPVTREEIARQVWTHAFVEEGSLTSHISLLRKTLAHTVNGDRYIETLPRQGYRFVARVKSVLPAVVPAAGKIMLVVLPFENLSGGEKYDYLSDGLTEEMITHLARIHPGKLGIIARTSAMQYKSTSKTAQQIGRELGVSHLLEGSVRRAGERVRITAQLIQVSDESHLWAESYERTLGDILDLQREIAQAITSQIVVTLSPQEKRLMTMTRSPSAAAHEAYLKGRYFWYKRTEEGMRKSIELFEQAISHEPGYAAAFDGISDAYTMLACRGVMPAREAFRKAKAAARKALQIEPNLGEAYASLAHVRLHDWDWVGLDQEFERALELNPGHAIAHYWYAEYLMAVGRSEESVARVQQAQRLDPVNSVLNACVAMILYLARRFDEAGKHLDHALEIDPNHFLLHFRRGFVYQQQGMLKEAVRSMEAAISLSGSSAEALTGLAQSLAAAGNRSRAQKILDKLTSEDKQRYVSPYHLARAYASMNDSAETFDWLERAYNEHNPDLIELRMEPSFDSVHSDQRFSDLLKQIASPL